MIRGAATLAGRLLGEDNRASNKSDAQVAQIRRLRAEGRTYEAIAKEVGCCLAYAQKVSVGTLRGQIPERVIYMADRFDLPRVRALVDQGHKADSIASALGLTPSSVRRLLAEVQRNTATDGS